MTTLIEERPAPAAVSPTRIAVVDDDSAEHVLMAMAAEAASLPLSLSFYTSGEEFLADMREVAPRRDRPEVIVLDLRMPGLGGYGTLDELQGDPALWDIPVVIFTSSMRAVERGRSYERGARLFQTKPSDFERLISLMRGLPLLAATPGNEELNDRRTSYERYLLSESTDPGQDLAEG